MIKYGFFSRETYYILLHIYRAGIQSKIFKSRTRFYYCKNIVAIGNLNKVFLNSFLNLVHCQTFMYAKSELRPCTVSHVIP